jgi:two-component system, NtrC family, sensor kinase
LLTNQCGYGESDVAATAIQGFMAAPYRVSKDKDVTSDRERAPHRLRLPDALEMLRLLLVATILLPLVLGAFAAYLSYLKNDQDATKSATEAVAVAAENTAKVLDTHLLVAARINDLLSDMTDDEIRASEEDIHDRITQQIAGLPQVAAAWVVDATGHELASARVYPVNRSVDLSNREDFKAFQNSDARTFIWMLRARSLDTGDYQPYFTVSLRRDTPDGKFNGVIIVAVSGSYFASFYNSLLGGTERYTASVLKDDGTVLARYPEPTSSPVPTQPDPLLAQAIADAAQSGVAEDGSPFDGGRVVAVKRVANYPVYVTIERKKASILQEWLRSVIGYTVIGVSAAIALIGLSYLALWRTRREQSALAEASQAVGRRAALEMQLHRAQRLEAVGLLTAGIAHDFNNVLTIIAGNIERVEVTLDEGDHRRQKMLTAAQDACTRAAALSKRLLGFARHEPINPRATNVNEIITNTLELPWKTGDRIRGEFRLSGDLWPVTVDPDQFATALLNLAFNARDAMPKGGRLLVETANFVFDDPDEAETLGVAPGAYVGIFVADTGHGMTEEIRQKALDPFFTTKDPGKGTGLGLALVNAFATRSGGCCAIDSETDKGTTIKIYLPRHRGSGDPEDDDAGDSWRARSSARSEEDRVRPN